MPRFNLGVARGLRSALVIALALTAARSSLAQTDDQRAAARSLASEGAAAFNQGHWQDAVDRFTRAETLVHAPPHLLYLARAHEKLGQLVAAREAYLKIVKETLPPNAPQAFREAQVAANQELRNVEPRLASLAIQVQGAENASDLKVLFDGAELPPVLVGVARPVDPGEHRIEATANGFRAAPTVVRLGSGEKKAIQLLLQPDPTAAPATPLPNTAVAPPANGAPLSATIPPPPPPTTGLGTDESSSKSTLRIGAYVGFGVAVVGAGFGTYFALSSRSKRSDADAAYAECSRLDDCRSNDPQARETVSLDDDARRALTLSIVSFAIGGVGLAAGTTLFVLSSGQGRENAGSFSLRAYAGLGAAGLKGSF